LHSLFTRGVDYDWKYYYASSPLSETNHSQFKFRIRTGILTEYYNKVNFGIAYADAYGSLQRHLGPTKLNFETQVLPDLAAVGGTVVVSLATAKGLTRIIQRKRVSRREFLGLKEST
jgi:hypothetical protein